MEDINNLEDTCFTNMVKGKIYHVKWGDRSGEMTGLMRFSGTLLNTVLFITQCHLEFNSRGCTAKDNRVKLASREQIIWYNMCVQAKRFRSLVTIDRFIKPVTLTSLVKGRYYVVHDEKQGLTYYIKFGTVGYIGGSGDRDEDLGKGSTAFINTTLQLSLGEYTIYYINANRTRWVKNNWNQRDISLYDNSVVRTRLEPKEASRADLTMPGQPYNNAAIMMAGDNGPSFDQIVSTNMATYFSNEERRLLDNVDNNPYKAEKKAILDSTNPHKIRPFVEAENDLYRYADTNKPILAKGEYYEAESGISKWVIKAGEKNFFILYQKKLHKTKVMLHEFTADPAYSYKRAGAEKIAWFKRIRTEWFTKPFRTESSFIANFNSDIIKPEEIKFKYLNEGDIYIAQNNSKSIWAIFKKGRADYILNTQGTSEVIKGYFEMTDSKATFTLASVAYQSVYKFRIESKLSPKYIKFRLIKPPVWMFLQERPTLPEYRTEKFTDKGLVSLNASQHRTLSGLTLDKRMNRSIPLNEHGAPIVGYNADTVQDAIKEDHEEKIKVTTFKVRRLVFKDRPTIE